MKRNMEAVEVEMEVEVAVEIMEGDREEEDRGRGVDEGGGLVGHGIDAFEFWVNLWHVRIPRRRRVNIL